MRIHVPDRWGQLLGGAFGELGTLIQFLVFIVESWSLDRRPRGQDWDLSVTDWFREVPCTHSFKEEVLKPFLYQFVSLPLDRIGESSARYATTYFARNIFGEEGVADPDVDPPDIQGKPVFATHQSLIGLDGILAIVLERSNATLVENRPVSSVAERGGKLVVTAGGQEYIADHVVLATDPPTSAQILESSQWDQGLIDELKKIEYEPLDICMQHGAPCYMPGGDEKDWEPVSTIVDGNNVMFTAWFGPLRPLLPDGKPIRVFKSWGASLDPPAAACGSKFFINRHNVLYPTTTSIVARDAIFDFAGNYQGKKNIWFVGGWTNWFDSQEACLDSATMVARRLPSNELPNTGRIVRNDPEMHRRHIRAMVRRIQRAVPADQRKHHEQLEKQLEKLDAD